MQLLSLCRGHLVHRIQFSLVLACVLISGCLASSFVKRNQPQQSFYLGETKSTQASSDISFTKGVQSLKVEYKGRSSIISFDGPRINVETGLLSFSRFRNGFKGPTVTPMGTSLVDIKNGDILVLGKKESMDKLVERGSHYLPMHDLEWVDDTKLVDIVATTIVDTPSGTEQQVRAIKEEKTSSIAAQKPKTSERGEETRSEGKVPKAPLEESTRTPNKKDPRQSGLMRFISLPRKWLRRFARKNPPPMTPPEDSTNEQMEQNIEDAEEIKPLEEAEPREKEAEGVDNKVEDGVEEEEEIEEEAEEEVGEEEVEKAKEEKAEEEEIEEDEIEEDKEETAKVEDVGEESTFDATTMQSTTLVDQIKELIDRPLRDKAGRYIPVGEICSKKWYHISPYPFIGGDSGKYYKVENNLTSAVSKVMNYESDRELAEIRLEEAILVVLNHPYIPKLLCTHVKNDKVELVMEHRGDTILTHLVSEDDRKLIIRQLVEVLEYLHSNQIYHRGVRSGSITFGGRGERCIALINFEGACGGDPKNLTFGSASGMASLNSDTIDYMGMGGVLEYLHRTDIGIKREIEYLSSSGMENGAMLEYLKDHVKGMEGLLKYLEGREMSREDFLGLLKGHNGFFRNANAEDLRDKVGKLRGKEQWTFSNGKIKRIKNHPYLKKQ